jgi:hypothetical protein
VNTEEHPEKADERASLKEVQRRAKAQAKEALGDSIGTFLGCAILSWLILWGCFHVSIWLAVPIACAIGLVGGMTKYNYVARKPTVIITRRWGGSSGEVSPNAVGAWREKAKEEQAMPLDAGRPECWRRLGWWDFEIAVLLAFECRGYEAQATEPSKDGGLDGIVTFEGKTYGLQCKHFGANDFVSVAEIRDFIGALYMKGLEQGNFVTTGQYSSAAKQLARDSLGTTVKVTLLSSTDLMTMGTGLRITKEVLTQAKERWHVPQEPPPDMPQGPQRKRHYRRFQRRW